MTPFELQQSKRTAEEYAEHVRMYARIMEYMKSVLGIG
jgi:hypothetical protein